jgi:hypothetical protein
MIEYFEMCRSFVNLPRSIDGEGAVLTITPGYIRWLLMETEIHPRSENVIVSEEKA